MHLLPSAVAITLVSLPFIPAYAYRDQDSELFARDADLHDLIYDSHIYARDADAYALGYDTDISARDTGIHGAGLLPRARAVSEAKKAAQARANAAYIKFRQTKWPREPTMYKWMDEKQKAKLPNAAELKAIWDEYHVSRQALESL